MIKKISIEATIQIENNHIQEKMTNNALLVEFTSHIKFVHHTPSISFFDNGILLEKKTR